MKKSLVTIILIHLISGCSYLPDSNYDTSGIILTETTEYILLTSGTNNIATKALVFYPGAYVDPHAYINIFNSLAVNYVKVIILKPAANLAITEQDKAWRIRKDFPEITQWFTGGHSLGGVAASATIKNHPNDYKGIILLASYPSKGSDLSNWNGTAISISASLDGLATPEKVEENKKYLPPGRNIDTTFFMTSASIMPSTTLYAVIDGGNHCQFGDYGFQKDDNKATISAMEQKIRITDFILAYIIRN